MADSKHSKPSTTILDRRNARHSPRVVGLGLLPFPSGRMGMPHLAEREAGGGALAGGGAYARGTRAASGGRRANLASEVVGDGEGHGSCATARARRPSMAAGSGWSCKQPSR
jgi:hypothetical protein